MKKKYLQVVTKLNDSKFKKLPSRGTLQNKAQQMYKNLWSMFDLTKAKNDIDILIRRLETNNDELSVGDFAWTKEVEDEFYNHSFHKRFVKELKSFNDMTWGMWCLDSEPNTIDENNQEVLL